MTNIPKKPRNKSLEYIRDNLYYENGRIINRRTGRIIGSLGKNRYMYISIRPYNKVVTLKSHHVIWFLCNNEWPSNEIDHVDRDKSNNVIDNLRVSTREENLHNRDKSNSQNKLGYLGVCQYISGGKRKYRAYINVNGRRIGQSSFTTVEDAVAWRKSKENELKLGLLDEDKSPSKAQES